MANDQGQKRRDDDLRNARNNADPQAPLASQPREGAHPGPGRDREAVRRGDASQQTDNGPTDLEPVKADQAAHSDKPKDDRGGGA